MKTLATTFKRGGFEFEQLKRDGNRALYRKRRAHWSLGNYSYESILIKAGTVFGVEKETFPASEAWGTLGWTDCDLASAERRYASLT